MLYYCFRFCPLIQSKECNYHLLGQPVVRSPCDLNGPCKDLRSKVLFQPLVPLILNNLIDFVQTGEKEGILLEDLRTVDHEVAALYLHQAL